MKVSIIVPVFNEGKTILSVLDRIKTIDVDKEIVVVDDGSTDGTRQILSEIDESRFSNVPIKILFHAENCGKGQAIQTGIEKSSGDIIAIQDADLEYDPSELIKLIGVFRDRPEIDAVYGSRFLGENPRLYRRYLWGNKLLTVGTNLLYKSKYTDTYTCYKAIKRNILLNLKLESKRFEIEAEISCKLAKGKYNVVEVPINYNPRTLQDGKKIKAKDALKGILAIIKYR